MGTASEGKYLTSSVCYRGAFSTQEVDLCVQSVQAKQSEDFVEWIPNNIKSSVVLYPGKEYALSCTFVANTTALKNMFQRLSTQFSALYKRKVSFTGTRERAWTRWSSRRPTRTLSILLLSIKTSR